MKLVSADIENFRSIKKCSIHFNEITAIVGENNAGKSAILRALNSFFNYEFEEPFFINAAHRYYIRTVTKIKLTFEDIPQKEIYKGKLINDQLIVQFSYAYSRTTKGRSIYCLTLGGKINAESMLPEIKKDIDFVYIPANRGTKDLSWTDNSIFTRLVEQYLHEYTKNRDLLSTQVKQVANHFHTQVLSRLEKELSELNMLASEKTYEVNFDEQMDYSILLSQLGISILEKGNSFPVAEYGSGIKSLTVIALHRMLSKNNTDSIILGIEEPETNLHPQAQKRLIASILNNRQDFETQAIFATHSTVIVDALDHEDIVLVRRVNDEQRGSKSVTSQLQNNFWQCHDITDYKHYNFFKYKNSDFFFAKYVVLSESITDAQVIDELIRSDLKDNYYNISLLSLDGVSNLKYPYFLLKDLDIPFSMVVDHDFFTPYINDKLEDSRDAKSCLPMYKTIVKRRNPVIADIWKSDEAIQELERKMSSSYTEQFKYLKKYHFFVMQYCLEMDLIGKSDKARNLYYDKYNLTGEKRCINELLVKRKDAVKDPLVLLPIYKSLSASERPISYKKIRVALVKLIQQQLS